MIGHHALVFGFHIGMVTLHRLVVGSHRGVVGHQLFVRGRIRRPFRLARREQQRSGQEKRGEWKEKRVHKMGYLVIGKQYPPYNLFYATMLQTVRR